MSMLIQGTIIGLAALVFGLVALLLGKVITFLLFLFKKGVDGEDIQVQVQDPKNPQNGGQK